MKLDQLNPTEADRLAAFNLWLIEYADDQPEEVNGKTSVDGSTCTDAFGLSFWVLTRKEVKDAGLWTDNLDTFRKDGCEWVIMPL